MDGTQDGSEAFVTFGRGLLKVFNSAKNFGFVSPVFKGEDSEGPPLPPSCDEGLWFFGNHSLPSRAVPGLELTFEIWENTQGKAQARSVAVAAEPTANAGDTQSREIERRPPPPRFHPNEPRVIYPSVYVSDVPVEWNESGIRKLHRQLGLNPDTIMGLKFLPFTEVSLGLAGTKGEKQATPVTGAVILRYLNEEAANAGVERLKGHPIQTSTGVTKHLGAKHATPPKWVVQRRQQEDEDKRGRTSAGESIMQKVRGYVVRVSMSGYGVIKSAEWGEVMWRQYELPTNLRTLQFADKAKFQKEVDGRDDYRRLKEMEGKEVEAELYKLPDGQLRASHVRAVVLGMITDAERPGGVPIQPIADDPAGGSPPSMLPHSMHHMVPEMPGSPPGMPPLSMHQMPQEMPPGMMPGSPPRMLQHSMHSMPPEMPPGMLGMPQMPGMPPGMAHMMMMMNPQMMQPLGKSEKKKDKKDKKEKKKEKKDRKRGRSSDDDDVAGEEPKKRKIDDNDF